MIGRLIGAGLALICAGCDGVKFADLGKSSALPNDFLNRTRIENTADFRFNMVQNIGAVIEVDSAKPGHFRLASTSVIRPDGLTISEKLLAKDDNLVFNAKVTGEASAQLGYATIGLKLDAKQAAEVSIVDISRAEIETPDIPVAKLRNYAATKPNTKQYWVKSLLLSRILKREYTEIKSDETGSGPAFGMSGRIYGTHAIQQQDWSLAAILIDLDTYKGTTGSPVAATVPRAFWTDEMYGIVKLPPLCAQPIKADGSPGTISGTVVCPAP